MLTWVQQYDGGTILFCIAVTREEFRVSAASGMDLFAIIFICKKQ